MDKVTSTIDNRPSCGMMIVVFGGTRPGRTLPGPGCAGAVLVPGNQDMITIESTPEFVASVYERMDRRRMMRQRLGKPDGIGRESPPGAS